MSIYNTQLQSNNTDLQAILNTINKLPEVSEGVDLPTLTNPAQSEEIFLNKETIDANGNIKVGTFTIDSELSTQNELLTELENVLNTKASGSGNGEASEWSENEDAIISGTITNYTNNRIVTIGHGAFAYHNSLISVSFPVCTSIGSYAFYYCSALTSVSFPACKTIYSYAFSKCTSLTSVFFPACTSIDGGAFYICSALTSVSFPACTSIGYSAFCNCSTLTSVSFPACTSIGYSAFGYCSALTSVSFPACLTIGDNAFSGCSALTSVSFPVCTWIDAGAFQKCSALTSVSFPVCTCIRYSAFCRCYTLSSLTLGASSVCKLSNSTAFSSTPFAGYSSYFSGTPHIYVPASLVDAYKSATNWVYFSSYITAIPEITFTIGTTEYQAIEGMTWGEWCNSNYNTINALNDGTNIYAAYGDRISINNGDYVKATDLIIENNIYIIKTSNSAG